MVEPVRHRRTKGAATDMFEPKATASHLDSTLPGHCALSNLSPLSGVHRKSDFGASQGSFCEGFRMTADRDDAACTGAVGRKPPMEERARGWVARLARARELASGCGGRAG